MDVLGYISSRDNLHQSYLIGDTTYSGTIIVIDNTHQSFVDGFVIGRSTNITGGLSFFPKQIVGFEVPSSTWILDSTA
jgi:hypothetical protein